LAAYRDVPIRLSSAIVKEFSMSVAARMFVGLVIAFHLAIFVGEALLWSLPAVHTVAIGKLNSDVALDVHSQAEVLRRLFINQGFYNLFVALGGMVGAALLASGRNKEGKALVQYVCAFAVGAGVVLMLSTNAHLGGALQSGLGAIALLLIRSTKTAP
jgi:putative membrane protein